MKNMLISIGIAGLLTLIGYGISKIKCHKAIKIVGIVLLFASYLAIQIIWINQSIVKPFADSENVYVSAMEMYLKNDTLTFHNYLEFYKHQIGLSAVLSNDSR